MGVGINAGNQIAGALGAVGVASRMIGAEKDSALAGGTQAKQTLAEVGSQLEADYKESDELEATLQNQKKEAEALGSMLDPNMSKEDAQAWVELKDELNKDQEMANIALTTLKGKIVARQSLQHRAEKQLKKAQRWGGSY